MNPKIATRRVSLLLLLFTLCASAVVAQTTSFTYQGRLTDGGTPANGTYDLQFALFDTVSGVTQIGTTQTIPNVPVSAGIFTVPLDFGATAFPGAPRFLEISARLTGTPSFTTLAPRQQITSTPYAIRSLNASSADAVTVSGVPGGSGNYIQNTTTLQSGAANFNISGNGTAGGTLSANIVNATTQYNIGGARILSAGGSYNVFVGLGSGTNTTGTDNAFFGALSGEQNSIGESNSFFGRTAGKNNTQGFSNSFFGRDAGFTNTTGSNNTVVGSFADVGSNLTNATAIGWRAVANQSNSIVLGGVSGVNFGIPVNVGIGTTGPTQKLAVETTSAGAQTLVTLNVPNTVGNNGALDFAVNNAGTIIPVAKVAAIYGAVNDIGLAFSTFNASGIAERVRIDKSGNVGIGTTTPQARLDVNGTALFQGGATVTGTNGDGAVLTARRPTGDPYVIIDATTVAQNSVLAYRKNNFNRWLLYADSSTESGGNAGSNFRLDAYNNGGGIANYLFVNRATGSVGIGTTTPFVNTKLDIVGGLLRLDQLGGGGDEPLCRNSAAHTIATCASSLRYKKDLAPFVGGLEILNRLRPISFAWKASGTRDLGLGAEDVAKVEPLLVTHNDKGEIEGVKYDRLNIVLINAVKQQQEQIETLRTANAALNARLQTVEKVVRKKVGSARRRR